jgi:hypothetical protein
MRCWERSLERYVRKELITLREDVASVPLKTELQDAG